MELFRLFGTIAVNNDEANESIDETTGMAEDSSNKIIDSFKKIGAAVAAAFAIDKIIEFGKATVQAAQEVAAEEAAFSQIMGEYTEQAAAKVAKIADATGIVDSRLTPYMTSMSAKFKGLGYDVEDATDFASRGLNLAADAAAFWDKSLDDSMSHLNSFINGSYEGGEAIGIFANDTQLAAFAIEQGVVTSAKAWGALDEATKQATRLEYAENMMALSGATGQAAKESGSYANVQANLTESWRQFKATIGEPILNNIVIPAMQALQPIIADLITKFENLKTWISENKDEISLWTGIILGAAVAVGTFLLILNWGSIMSAAATALNAVKTAVLAVNAAMAANPIGLIISLIAGLIAAFIYFWNTSDEFRQFWIDLWDGIKEVFSAVVDWIVEAFNSVVEFFKNLWASITEGFNAFGESVKETWNAIGEFFSGLWDGIVNIFTTAWETIKNAIQVAFMFIVELVKAYFNLITLPFRFIWENCKDTIIEIWNAITEFLSDLWDGIKETAITVFTAVSEFFTTIFTAISEFFTSIWNAISTFLAEKWNAISKTATTIFNAISNFFTAIWNGIKNTVTGVVDAIKQVVTTVFNAIKDFITTIFNAVKNVITTVWNGIKNTITTVINAIKTTVTNIFNAIKSAIEKPINAVKTTVTNVFNAIKNAITKPIDDAKNLVKKGLDAIKGFFDKLKLSLPKIKLPHFSIKGSFSLDPPSVPRLAIDWYAKGGILKQPTAFGINPITGNIQAGGEAGHEAVAPISLLLDYIRTAVREENSSTAYILNQLISMLAEYFPQIVNGMNRNVVLETGVLVGELAPAMDSELGDINRWRGRGR